MEIGCASVCASACRGACLHRHIGDHLGQRLPCPGLRRIAGRVVELGGLRSGPCIVSSLCDCESSGRHLDFALSPLVINVSLLIAAWQKQRCLRLTETEKASI